MGGAQPLHDMTEELFRLGRSWWFFYLLFRGYNYTIHCIQTVRTTSSYLLTVTDYYRQVITVTYSGTCRNRANCAVFFLGYKLQVRETTTFPRCCWCFLIHLLRKWCMFLERVGTSGNLKLSCWNCLKWVAFSFSIYFYMYLLIWPTLFQSYTAP